MANKRIQLEPDRIYHIYNHAVGSENLFQTKENYKYFLRKYAEYINPIAETYTYCLMPNHFHFLIKIKSEGLLNIFYEKKYKSYADPSGFQNPKGLSDKLNLQTVKHFGNFFNSYAKAYNKQNQRRGSLFENSFRRIEVNSDNYLRKLVQYIHYNPIHHGFTEYIGEWDYSSYNAILSNSQTSVNRKEVIGLFDDLENFIFFHKKEGNNFESVFD